MQKSAERIFRIHVREAYDTIASDFDRTRQKCWQEVEDFIRKNVRSGTKFLDAGCGNGRHMKIAAELGSCCIGFDIARNLIKLAKTKEPLRACNFLIADARMMPFRSHTFDVAICIAVLHHIPDEESRVKLLLELMRVLKQGGKALLSVWSRSARKLAKLPAEVKDAVITWGKKRDLYYHIFDRQELEQLAEKAGITNFRVWESNDNIWLEFEKEGEKS